MTKRHKQLELEDEKNAERRYAKLLREQAGRQSAFYGPRNALWTGSGVPQVQRIPTGELIGRVGLVAPDEDGDSDFYIGERYANLDGVHVYGWTTPVACTFFRGTEHHPLCDSVAVVRAFRRLKGEIVDFVDDVLRQDGPAEPFTKRGLTIPAPPSRPKMPASRLPAAASAPAGPAAPGAAEGGVHSDPRVEASKSTSDASQHKLPAVRAEVLLREQLLAPRTKRLAPVLATLQPDQYELVAVPAMESMVIDGQPGTGKTIIAAHRAAYLVNDETPPENTLDGDILVVGPTVGYSNHVQEAILRLAGPTSRIKILSLPELADRLIGKQSSPHAGASRSYHDVGWELARFARSAIAKLRKVRNITPTTEEVVEYMRKNPGLIAKDVDWQAYLRGLPPYRQAVTYRVHAPLIAFIKWEIARPAELKSIEHIIVDEAQDVTPLEWLLLDEINEADAWTILGDLNQRRSDHTLASWAQVMDVLAIDPDTPVRRLQRGYRSTRPILQFANRLLPRNMRKINAFQHSGPDPTVRKFSRKSLIEGVLGEIDRLSTAYPNGTLGVLCLSSNDITSALRVQGWSSSMRDPHLWSQSTRELTVAHPDAMRGLEFDAVVVVEPGDFPQNFGRQGLLYTALTRANRELAVVHSGPLPEALRRR